MAGVILCYTTQLLAVLLTVQSIYYLYNNSTTSSCTPKMCSAYHHGSEEDKQLQEELNMLVERLVEDKEELYLPSLESLRSLIRASTTSMTSVPKPLKFMRTHYDTMKDVYSKINEVKTKEFCADVISVLAMTLSDGRDCLKFRLLGSQCEIGDWGHEYVRHLSGEIASEWADVVGADFTLRRKLLALVRQIVPYNLAHNAEAEACDLAMEIDHLELLEHFVDESTYPRVCLYLTSCVPYVPDPENIMLLHIAMSIFKRFKQYPQALRVAMQMNTMQFTEEIFNSCTDLSVQKQLAFMLGRHQIFLELNENMPDYDDLVEIMSNAHLNNHFLNLARELDIMEPKTPEDVYKSHLENTRTQFVGGQVDSARQNLAASFVNGFVNAGFGHDKLLMEDGNKWLYKNKEHVRQVALFSVDYWLCYTRLFDDVHRCICDFIMDCKHEQRVNIKFCGLLGKSRTETFQMMQQAYGNEAISRPVCFEWHSRFRSSRTSPKDEERSGRPCTSTNSEIVDRVRHLVHEDCWMTIKNISDIVLYGSVQTILTLLLS
ncbi:unnamed protein product [Timema podura]|uniref:RPN1 N-terminal domain-containing protein n=1 Tax=Timema podura TaxID=61482 RepID=A0ABN7NJ73_TIMPD|nr:unnamed protein product [Timema podura]